MLSLISLGRSAWAKLQAAHPVIRWGGAILVGLALLDFFAHEAIDLFIKVQTARATIDKANADAANAEIERRAMGHRQEFLLPPPCPAGQHRGILGCED